ETENATSRLGLLASLGFLTLLAALVLPASRRWARDEPLLLAAATLTLALVLLGTVGGFGSLFNLLVSPEIRAYNRVSPFIALYAWIAMTMVIDRLMPSSVMGRAALVLGLGAVGVWDQTGALEPLNREYAETRTEWTTISTFVTSL